MTAPTNQPTSTDTSGTLPRPEGANASSQFFEGATPIFSRFIGPDWLECAYEFPDKSVGYFTSDGQKGIHYTNTNNIVISAGKPSQGGCGGKMVFNTQGQIHSTTSFAMEVSGKENESTTEETKEGDVETTEPPAYSLKVYGDIQIECVGGEIFLKGDNITLNASNTLNLVSGKDVNIQAGGDSGSINLKGANVKVDAAFLKKNASSGEYSTAAEVQSDQILPGSSTVINSVGGVEYHLDGNYKYSTTGNYTLSVGGTFDTDVTLDYALTVNKNYGAEIKGKYKSDVKGVVSDADPSIPNYQIIVGPGKGSKELPAFSVDSQGPIQMSSALGGFKATSGAKAASELSFDEKQGTFRVGSKLGSLTFGPKSVDIEYTKTSKISLDAARVTIDATAIFLN